MADYKNVTVDLDPRRKHEGSLRRRKIVGNIVVYTILILICIIWMFPFLAIVFQSFNVDWYYQAIASGMEPGKGGGIVGYLIPEHWDITNYVNLFTKTKFLKWYLNTFITAVVTALIQVIMILAMAYVLSRMRFKGRKLLMNFMLILGMFPGFLTMIVLYFLLKDMHLTEGGAVGGLILVYTASSGMGYYVSKGFFDTVPKSLDEAARIDGANRLQVMTRVILPLSGPIIVYTVLTAFMGPWGDFMFAKYVAHNVSDAYNVAVGLQDFLDKELIPTSYTLFCAGGVVVAIPVTILFMILQRFYVEGVTGGAVKG